MTGFEKFNFKTLTELRAKIEELELEIDLSEDLSPLSQKPSISGRSVANALAILPMEGCDALEDGSPSELTLRRYRRFAGGGAGLLWFEATAVVPEGRSNAHQLQINSSNYLSFKELLAVAFKAARDSMGEEHQPVCILQLNHSGRYSKPDGKPHPVIAYHDPLLDSGARVHLDQHPVTDLELEQLQDQYVEAAYWAQMAGFDGVDIKACHRYLVSELLAGYTRPGNYGGSFKNRTRFLLETIEKVRARTGDDFIIAVRLNAYDALPYPYGWGVDTEDSSKPDLSEPIKLVHLLREKGVSLVSVSAGNPYYIYPEVTRPFDTPLNGAARPAAHPLYSVARLFHLAEQIQKAEPEVAVVGGGYSWLRHFLGNAAAANLARGAVTIAGAGREAFAYPDFAKDLLTKGAMDSRKCCISCSKCAEIKKAGDPTGCVTRDREVYLPVYKGTKQL